MPTPPIDTQSLVNPYLIGELIWTQIAPYLEKYDVAFSESHPTEAVSRPTIVWEVARRVPGLDGLKGKSRAPMFAYDLGRNKDTGLQEQMYQQEYTVFLEYSIYGGSSSKLGDLAWDLERAVLSANYSLGRLYPGYRAFFHEQRKDDAIRVRPFDLLSRKVVFLIHLPISFVVSEPTLAEIQYFFVMGRLLIEDARLTRTSSATAFHIPVKDFDIVTGITLIHLIRSGKVIVLEQGTDFDVIKDDNSPRAHIGWRDGLGGLTPNVGEEFKVSYTKATVFMADITKHLPKD